MHGRDASIAGVATANALLRMIGAVAMVAAPRVFAQPAVKRPILHEPIADITSDKSRSAISGRIAKNPAAIAAGDKVLPKPPLDMASTAPPQAPVLGTHDFSADRRTAMKPDANTSTDQTLRYVSVFNPDVLPWKRMSAFDKVGEDFTLRVQQRGLTELRVGGANVSRARDSFWGDMTVQIQPGVNVAIPSVAPDMRILSYETDPKVQLVFSKDGADNFYVRSDERTALGRIHLVFHADADADYFTPRLPAHSYRVRDVSAVAPRDITAELPEAVLREAATTLANLGLHRELDLAVAVSALVRWGRGFVPGEIRNPTQNIYRDLCDRQVGVCRHRSYAFAVTAIALGIPTRVVENEAHAFVEVWFPERNWQRIDLGGAALQLHVSGASNKQLHRPRGDDLFAKPPQYRNNYTELEGNISGLTDQQRADRKRPLAQQFRQTPPTGIPLQLAAETAPSPPLPSIERDPQKPTPTLIVTRVASSAYRGELLHVEGTVQVGGRPIANLVVGILLAQPDNAVSRPIQLGALRSEGDGTFRGDLPVPPHVPLSTYKVYASCQQDTTYNAARSE